MHAPGFMPCPQLAVCEMSFQMVLPPCLVVAGSVGLESQGRSQPTSAGHDTSSIVHIQTLPASMAMQLVAADQKHCQARASSAGWPAAVDVDRCALSTWRLPGPQADRCQIQGKRRTLQQAQAGAQPGSSQPCPTGQCTGVQVLASS